MCVSSPVPSTLVFGAVDVLLFCRLGGFRFLRSVRGKGVLPVQMRSDRRFSLRFQSEALKFSSDNRRLLSALDFVCVLQGARRRCQ